MFGKTLVLSIVCGLLAILAQPTSAAAAAPSLTGSWQITLTPIAPPTPNVQILGLATFTSDGSVIETDTSQVVPEVSSTGTATGSTTYGTPGHGVWQPMPSLTNLYVQYISLAATSDGSLAAKSLTTMVVGLNSTGTQFTGNYTTTQATTSGQSKTISGTVKGQLIPHPLLP